MEYVVAVGKWLEYRTGDSEVGGSNPLGDFDFRVICHYAFFIHLQRRAPKKSDVSILLMNMLHKIDICSPTDWFGFGIFQWSLFVFGLVAVF